MAQPLQKREQSKASRETREQLEADRKKREQEAAKRYEIPDLS